MLQHTKLAAGHCNPTAAHEWGLRFSCNYRRQYNIVDLIADKFKNLKSLELEIKEPCDPSIWIQLTLNPRELEHLKLFNCFAHLFLTTVLVANLNELRSLNVEAPYPMEYDSRKLSQLSNLKRLRVPGDHDSDESLLAWNGTYAPNLESFTICSGIRCAGWTMEERPRGVSWYCIESTAPGFAHYRRRHATPYRRVLPVLTRAVRAQVHLEIFGCGARFDRWLSFSEMAANWIGWRHGTIRHEADSSKIPEDQFSKHEYCGFFRKRRMERMNDRKI